MLKKLLLLCSLFVTYLFNAQVVINELDSDTPSTDVLEFIELKSSTPNFALTGYVLTLYNGGSDGNSNLLYYAIDLSDIVTDVNGLAVIGNQLVSPTPNFIIPNNTIQNGADVIAIYRGNIDDFTIGSAATTTNLVDVLAYTTSGGANPTALMQALQITTAYNENGNRNIQNHSLQRQADGTFVAATPNPFRLNDGSGVEVTSVSIIPSTTVITEGENLTINLVLSNPLPEQTTITLQLNNGTFNTQDFAGSLDFTFPIGATTSSNTIQILNDGITEGDEELKIGFVTIPQDLRRLNNNIVVRVYDINIRVLNYGRPTQPTYTYVESTAPQNYYQSAIGLSGENLRIALQNIIANQEVVRKHTYGDIVEILKNADVDPKNSSNVWLMYKETTRSKIDYQGAESSSTGKWNREHIYPQSRGGFSGGTPSYYDGFDIWEPTSKTDIAAGHSDGHHLRAEDGPENSSRNNKNYGGTEYNGFNGNAGSWKGDVARAVFYMATRYVGLTVENGFPLETGVGKIGDLTTLLNWHQLDPADDFEMNHNNVIYTWQKNRNPYIDYPELIRYIWGDLQGQPWQPTMNVNDIDRVAIKIYPNPSTSYLSIAGIASGNFEIYNTAGMCVMKADFIENNKISHSLPSGIYMIHLKSSNKILNQKLIVR